MQKHGRMLSIDFVKISNSIYRQVNISESRSISRFIDLAILGVWPIALRLFIVHVINCLVIPQSGQVVARVPKQQEGSQLPCRPRGIREPFPRLPRHGQVWAVPQATENEALPCAYIRAGSGECGITDITRWLWSSMQYFSDLRCFKRN